MRILKKQHISSLPNYFFFTSSLFLNPFFREDIQLKQEVKTDAGRAPTGLTLATTLWYETEGPFDFHGSVVKGITRF
jgi:hypothetical protein